MTDKTPIPPEGLSSPTASERIATVGWVTDRTPKNPKPVPPRSDEDRAIWPNEMGGQKALKPKTGPLRDNAPVLFVTLFDVSAERVAQAVRQIMRQQKAARNFTPLFLTNSLDTAPIRRAGYTFEFMPATTFCQPKQATRFNDRFLTLWRKWSGAALIDFSALGFLANRVEDLEVFVQREDQVENRYNPRKKAKAPVRPAPTDIAALRAEYRSKGMDQQDDTFVLYRIIGNDLPPRHEVGQTLRNVTFLLENEPPLERCEKRWVVNRIVDPEQEAAIIALLEKHDQPYLHIPFYLSDYHAAEWDHESFPDDAFFLSGRYHNMTPYDQLRAQAHARRLKNSYVINNNGARNAALRDGRDRAKWVLPWDGNCFLTAAAWAEIVNGVTDRPYLKYFTVPMARTLDNAELLDPDFRPPAEEEPQMLFRNDASEEFDETFYYGRRPKVELFYRLGIPGKWDGWPDDVWDRPRAPRSPDAGSSGTVGWVARLFSGQAEQEQNKVNSKSGLRARGEARISAISDMLDRLDVKAAGSVYAPENLTTYDPDQIRALAAAPADSPEAKYIARMTEDADLALQRGPYSVVDKTATPPSGDPHDYYNPAPYWWPNPATANGMPFLFRDGDRIPGTRLYELESERYDRTRLQRLFDDTTTLSLAWVATGQGSYIQHAASHIRTWFLDEKTRMNPHLLYSQVRSKTIHDVGSKSGLIEMKDLYFFLDAVRLVEQAGALSDAEKEAFREWLRSYLEWLQTSDQGLAERLSPNNHGTCYDLQTASIAAFLGDTALLQEIFRTSRERMLEQFTIDGQQPHEMKRTQTAHYCAFNMHCWINLANLAEACGDRLWMFEAEDGRGLASVFGWLLPRLARKTWKFEQIEPFDRARFLQLFFAARNRAPVTGGLRLADPVHAKPLFFPHDGIKPYWMINPPVVEVGRSVNWQSVANSLQKLETAAFDMLHGHAGQQDDPHPDDLDVKVLDKKLWGGFSTSALAALETLRMDLTIPRAEINRASRSLARWHFNAQDPASTLACTETMVDLNFMDSRELTLLRSDCFDRLGDVEAAQDALGEAIKTFAKDADLNLMAANLGPPSPASIAGAINKVFANVGLPDALEATDGKLCPVTVQPLQADRKEADRISVILTIDQPSDGLADTITSILSQSWTNLELIVSDAMGRGGNQVRSSLASIAETDDRVLMFKTPAGQSQSAMRNAALRKATGTFVTAVDQDDIVHPTRLAAQVAPLLAGEASATLVQQVRLDSNLKVLGGWVPDFSCIQDKPSSLMLPTEDLRASGGWDAVPGEPDAYLAWRIKKVFGKNAVQTVLPRLPVTITRNARSDTGPGHQDFPFGRRRDDLRRLLRQTAVAMELHQGDEPTLPPALRPQNKPNKLDVVFVGDFSTGSAALEQIVAKIAERADAGGTIGVFHWPDYDDTWSAQIDEALAELIDDAGIIQVSPFEDCTSTELVLCHSTILHHRIDGFPDFGPDKLVVFGGTELAVTPSYDGYNRPSLLRHEIEAKLGQKVALLSL